MVEKNKGTNKTAKATKTAKTTKQKSPQKAPTKDVVEYALKIVDIETDLEDRFPSSGGQIMHGFRAAFIDFLLAGFIVDKPDQFVKAVKTYNQKMNDFLGSQEYYEAVDKVGSGGPHDGSDEQDEVMEEAIEICRQTINHLSESFVNLSKNGPRTLGKSTQVQTKAKRQPAKNNKKKASGPVLRDIDGNEIML